MSRVKELNRDKKITRFTHRIFFRAMLEDKKNLAIAMLHYPSFFLINAFIPLYIAYVLQAIIQKQFDLIGDHLIIISISVAIAIVCMYIANQADSKMGMKGAAYLQRLVFRNFLDKDYDFYSSQYVGSVGSQASRLRDAFLLYVHEFKFVISKNLIIVVSILLILMIKSVTLFIISLFLIAFFLGYTYITSKKRILLRRLSSEASSGLAGIEADAISHGSAVKSFAAENYELEYSRPSMTTWYEAQLKTWLSLEPSNSIRLLFGQLAIIALLIISASLYKNNEITIALVILIQFYMIRLINVSLDIAEVIKQYEYIMGMAYNSVQTMKIDKTVVDEADTTQLPEKPSSIRFNQVTFYYPEHKNSKAVDDLSVELRKGQKVGLVGYSGAGKTTLTKLILRFMDVNAGSITIDGIDIKHVKQSDLRRKIAYVPQEPLLFHRSIYDNIAYGRPEATDAEILRAAKAAYVDEFAEKLPKKYQTIVGERGVKLSGGQRQRVAIARAILKDAPILVLDEATSALDSESEKYIQNALWKLMKGRTALVIAHRLSTIQKMDKVLVMDKGKIVEEGTHNDLLESKGIYRELWKHQSGGYVGVENG